MMATYLLTDIDDAIYRRVKSLLAAEGKTMKQFLAEALRDKAEQKPERRTK